MIATVSVIFGIMMHPEGCCQVVASMLTGEDALAMQLFPGSLSPARDRAHKINNRRTSKTCAGMHYQLG